MITKNKTPAIHIPGQTLQHEPFKLHAMIFISFENPMKRFRRVDPQVQKKLQECEPVCNLAEFVRIQENTEL